MSRSRYFWAEGEMQFNTFHSIAEPASPPRIEQSLSAADKHSPHQPFQLHPAAESEDTPSQSYIDIPCWHENPVPLTYPNDLDLNPDFLELNSFASSDIAARHADLFQPLTHLADEVEHIDRRIDQNTLPHINQDLGNFSQWIEGAYMPSSPCLYCLQHRLQCLVLRTDLANPNPVTSCASCVALFRECSMAQGSKRLPSEFETAIPVMGQLHGVIEENGERVAGWGGTGEPANTRKQISRRSIRPLKDWLSAHQDDPFPSHEEKLLLELQSGLTKVQISNWFANARRRQKGITVTMPPLPIIRNRQLSDTDGRLLAMNPMERWANSPPESEPAQSSMVAKAAGNLPLANSQGLEYGSYISPYSRASGPTTSSVRSFGTDSSDNSNNSSISAWSEASHCSFKKRKQRARRRSARPKTKINPTEDNGCVYECTFCSESFSLRYDWQRHEQSIHLPMERWICSPDSLLVPLPINGNLLVCMFCQESSPTAEHLATHDAEACLERPPEGRTFTRKDHLRQHLRKYHGCQSPSSLDWILDSWKVENMNFRSRCGFCGTWFSAWKERSAHLASHFQRGTRMSEWSGDHGFDEESQRLLTNVTHPNIVKKQEVG